MSFPIVGSSGDAPGETFADSFDRIANNIESEESAMAWSPDGLNARADATAALVTHISLHKPVSHIGMWASSTFLSGWARTSGDAAANAAGEYNVAAAPITAS